jgi:transcriptional regulator with XRE-family HTH domain
MAGKTDNRIGEYLRARRELLRPEDVGLQEHGHRRVPGLRREEMAMLAGISNEYYLRLEQGRDQHPSDQVLNGLARALQLDEDAAAYLKQLAEPRERTRRRPPRLERVSSGVKQLLASWVETPAYVQGRNLDVLESNPLAVALSPIFTPGVNLVQAAFLDPAVKDLYRDWEALTAATVAGLRAQNGPDIGDPRLQDLVGELSLKSDRFAKLWSRHDVRPKSSGSSFLDHPVVGPLDLKYEKLAVGASGTGQLVVIYYAEPGSPTADALALLATTAKA